MPVPRVDLLFPSFPMIYYNGESGGRIESYGPDNPGRSAGSSNPEGTISFVREYTSGAIIPALMHRIPSELRS